MAENITYISNQGQKYTYEIESYSDEQIFFVQIDKKTYEKSKFHMYVMDSVTDGEQKYIYKIKSYTDNTIFIVRTNKKTNKKYRFNLYV